MSRLTKKGLQRRQCNCTHSLLLWAIFIEALLYQDILKEDITIGEAMKIFSSENCLKESVIFTLRDKILKEQVMTGFKYLKVCHSENTVLFDSEDISKMNVHTFSGVKCRFILRPCI